MNWSIWSGYRAVQRYIKRSLYSEVYSVIIGFQIKIKWETDDDPLRDYKQNQNLYWNRYSTHTGPGTDHELMPVLYLYTRVSVVCVYSLVSLSLYTREVQKPIMNTCRFRTRLGWLMLILHPYRSWNRLWTHTGSGADTEPIPVLISLVNGPVFGPGMEPIRIQFLSSNWFWYGRQTIPDSTCAA